MNSNTPLMFLVFQWQYTVTTLSNFVNQLHIASLFNYSFWCPHAVNHACVCIKRSRVTLVTVMALF